MRDGADLIVHWLFKVFATFLFVVPTICVSQEVPTKTKFLRVEAPLSSGRVTCILQDRHGFLWVGTEDGLNRFDGYEFKVYRHVKDDSTSLLKNLVISLFEDRDGTLWVSQSSGGLQRYNPATDNFSTDPRYSFDCEVKAFADDASGLWIAGIMHNRAFIDRYDKSNGSIQRHDYALTGPVHTLIRKSPNEFWVGVRGNGFYRWTIGADTLERVRSVDGGSIISNDLHELAADNAGNIWAATTGGVSRYDVRSQTFTHFTTRTGHLTVNNVLHLCADGSAMWMGTENGGACKLDLTTGNSSCHQFDRHDPNSIADNSIWATYRDREGRIWFGTYTNGLCLLDPKKEKFREVEVTMENDIVNAMHQDKKGRYWFGTEGGLVMYDGKNTITYHGGNGRRSITSDPVLSLAEDRAGNIWAGTWDGGLNRYDPRTASFTAYRPDPANPESLSSPHVFAIHQMKNNDTLLVGTYSGLNILGGPVSKSFDRVTTTDYTFNNFVRTIFEDSRGTVWLGSIAELLTYDPDTKTLSRFETATHPDSIQISGLSNDIHEDRYGNIWVATNNGLHLVKNSQFVKKYTSAEGLPSDLVYAILEDHHGNLWLSSAGGISRFNPKDETFRNYDASDGVMEKGFKPGAALKNEKGQFLFGGKGINVFYPDSVRDNPDAPPVFITLVDARQRIIRGELSLPAREITLSPEENNFTIQYVAPNFTASAKNRYAYRLEGFDDRWHDVGGQRSVSYTNLDPGRYIFTVRASNNDGLWNETGSTLVIHILPAWYETWWFRIVLAMLCAAVVTLVFRLRMRNIKRRNRILEQLVSKRTEELAQQNDRLRESSEEIAAQRDLLSTRNHELEIARHTIEKQNQEIRERNETLEAEVEERTKGLVEYNQQLEQFAFVSAHNLRAPVARILGLGNLVDMTKGNPSELREIAGKLVDSTRELDAVVRDLSKILDMRKSITQTVTEVDLPTEMKRVRTELASEIKEINASIVEDFSNGSRVRTIQAYLDSILLNLISNAIKYRDPTRDLNVRVSTCRSGEYLMITIEDNGLGLDLESHGEKLFSLYRRFHTHVEGKGMGLYLVKAQVIMLGGRIEVQSRVGQGTRFTIYLKDLESRDNPDADDQMLLR